MISRLFYSLIFLLLFTGLAKAGAEIAISPSGSSDQIIINNALEAVYQSGGGIVYLSAGIYNIEGPIYIKSDTVLSGDADTILRVSSSSSQWFQGAIGIISCQESLQNVEIYGFQIDGNIKNLPASFSDSRADTSHDCQKEMILGGYSNQHANNISIHDMTLYNSFSDGIYIRYADNVSCYNNIISNCQHEGIFWSGVTNGQFYNNKIAGITSDCGRLDNCVNCKVSENVFFSYNGDSFGEYKHGENGLQIADGGYSHGYDATDNPMITTNIEVCENTFSDPGLKTIWLHGGKNVYIHDNDFVDATGLETLGVPVGDISYENPPTVEQSKQVFSSIFDILNYQFSTTALVPQTNQIRSVDNWQKKGENTEATLSIDGFRNLSEIDGVEYIPGKAQDNVIVNYQTRNDALFSAGQTSKLSYQENNSTLMVYLQVDTSWYTKSSHIVSILGKHISVPDISTKNESEVYSASVPEPELFPKTSEIQANVTYYNNSYNPHSIVSISNAWEIVQETYTYNGSEANHFKLVGEVSTKDNGFSYVNYSKISTWKSSDSQISGFGGELYITGKFNPALLNISVQTPYETVKINKINVTEVPDQSGLISNPGLWAFVGTLTFFGIFIYRNFRRVIRKW
jgi:parallel beta-helix repeat protein